MSTERPTLVFHLFRNPRLWSAYIESMNRIVSSLRSWRNMIVAFRKGYVSAPPIFNSRAYLMALCDSRVDTSVASRFYALAAPNGAHTIIRGS